MHVGANAILGADVKVYPFKTIEDGAVVNSSIVWESRGASHACSAATGVDGLANVDITPELAAKLAMAYGTSLRKGEHGGHVARLQPVGPHAEAGDDGRAQLGRDQRARPRGGLHAGHPLPRAVAPGHRRADGAPAQRRPAERGRSSFFDATGVDIAEDAQRKIERLFQREDYRRALPEEIGDISFPHRALEDYTAALAHDRRARPIAERQFKLVVDYGYGATSLAMPNVLTKLRADVLAVNPYASTTGRLSLRSRRPPSKRVADLVRASGAQLGAVLRPGGERLTLIDDEGEVLTPHRGAAVLRRARLRPPAGRPHRPAGEHHRARRAHRRPATASPSSTRRCPTPALMEAATQPGVGFAADGQGGYILPGFLPAFDAAAALVKMLDLLARSGRQLAEVRRGAAGGPHGPRDGGDAVGAEGAGDALAGREGRRRAGARRRRQGAATGVDWALALPDPAEPVTHLWAEAGSAAEARACPRTTPGASAGWSADG